MIPSQFLPLANHLWQSTLFAAIAGLLTLAFRNNRAHVRYSLWLAASLKFLIPFSLFVAAGSYLGRHTVVEPAPTAVSSFSDWVEQASTPFAVELQSAPAVHHALTISLPMALLATWAAGFLWLACTWAIRWRRLSGSLRYATAVDLPLGVAAFSSPEFCEPGVFGILRPVLLLPAGIAERLSPHELHAVLTHELCHVRRRDNLATAIHMAVEAVFWFHPLVWWLGARLMDERERACDEEVLRTCGEPHIYAEGILKTCELYMSSPLACTSGVTGGDLKRRIEAIVANRMGLRLNYAKKTILGLAGIAAVAVPVAIGIMHAPAIHAQSPQPAAQAAVALQAAPAPAQAPTPQAAPAPAPQVAPAPKPKFDVASIKPCVPGQNAGPGRGGGGGGAPSGDSIRAPGIGGYFGRSPGRFWINCGSLLSMISISYVEFGDPLINDSRSPMQAAERVHGVPNWAMDARYTIEATSDDPAANGPTDGMNAASWRLMVGPMLQSLLEERFDLKIHREQQDESMYALRVAKGGVKIKPMQDGDCVKLEPGQGMKMIGPDDKPYCGWMGWDTKGPNRVLMGGGVPLKRIADLLSDIVMDHHVVDETGPSALYNIHLEYSPDEHTLCMGPSRMCAVDTTSSIPPAASIGSALEQQLGLRLETVKAPHGFIVIDRVEKPSEN